MPYSGRLSWVTISASAFIRPSNLDRPASARLSAASAAAGVARGIRLTCSFAISSLYAAQQASGSRAWVGDDDHIEKAFDYAGMPARNGVTAALLIKSGFTGNRDVLEGDQGIIKTYAPCDPKKLLAELGQRLHDHQLLDQKISGGLADDGNRRCDLGVDCQAADSERRTSKESSCVFRRGRCSHG